MNLNTENYLDDSRMLKEKFLHQAFRDNCKHTQKDSQPNWYSFVQY